jgi:hypothetical protein
LLDTIQTSQRNRRRRYIVAYGITAMTRTRRNSRSGSALL